MKLKDIKPGETFMWNGVACLMVVVDSGAMGFISDYNTPYVFSWTRIGGNVDVQHKPIQFDMAKAYRAIINAYQDRTLLISRPAEYDELLAKAIASREVFTDEDILVFSLQSL